MITYELAKQLKDAGFQQGGDGYAIFEDGDKINVSFLGCGNIPSVYVPTLSELIEACGEEEAKYKTRFLLKTPFNGMWEAQFGEDMNDGSGFVPIRVEGKTPEEAVARLWIELNRQKLN